MAYQVPIANTDIYFISVAFSPRPLAHSVNYVLQLAISIQLHVKVALRTSIGDIAKCIGYK